MSLEISSLVLVENLTSRDPNMDEINTWFMGCQHIYGDWISPGLPVESCFFAIFGYVVEDHRAIVIDISYQLVLGTVTPQIFCPINKIRQIHKPKVRNRYSVPWLAPTETSTNTLISQVMSTVQGHNVVRH